MMDNYYKGQDLVDEYSKFGSVEVNQMHGVARIVPHVEQRYEVIVDSSVPDDVELEDIPPHLKYGIDLFFVNTPAIYPVKHMLQCVSPGKLQVYTGKVWEDTAYVEEWAAWEGYVEEMPNIYYPFVVLPNQNIYPRTWRLMDNERMTLFKTLLADNNRQVTLADWEKTWMHLFNPENHSNPDYPIAAWMHICTSPNAYVDVITVNPDRTANVIFTVPPLMSLNQGLSSIMEGKKTINIESMVMRCRSESAVVPHSGDERLLRTFESNQAEPQELSKHAKMWKVIYDRYGWSFITEDGNTVNKQPIVQASNGSGSIVDDQMDDIVF